MENQQGFQAQSRHLPLPSTTFWIEKFAISHLSPEGRPQNRATGRVPPVYASWVTRSGTQGQKCFPSEGELKLISPNVLSETFRGRQNAPSARIAPSSNRDRDPRKH